MEIWRKIFTYDNTKDHENFLHIVELHLIAPFSDAK